MGRLGTQRLRPTKPARPFLVPWTGRPGGSGAQPPLHLIYMVRVERSFKLGYIRSHLKRFMMGLEWGLLMRGESKA